MIKIYFYYEIILINMNTLGQKSKKIVLIDDGCVGKTSYVSWLRKGSFERKYIPTMGVEVNPVNYWETNNLNDIFNICDCACQEKYGYWKGASGAIVMFNITNKLSFEELFIIRLKILIKWLWIFAL